MTSLIIMIDGGHLRAQARRDSLDYTADFIEDFASAIVRRNEELLRVYYYDCRPYQGDTQQPVSGDPYSFKSGGSWLDELAARDYFLVRTGSLRFRGWKPKLLPLPTQQLTDQDFRPDFEQKGVDLQIGLDIARVVETRACGRLLLVSADPDLIPAMTVVRASPVQLVGIEFPSSHLHGEVLSHFDVIRDAPWPPPPLKEG